VIFRYETGSPAYILVGFIDPFIKFKDLNKGKPKCGELIHLSYLLMNAGGSRSTDLNIVRIANGPELVPVLARISASPVLIPKDTELEIMG